MITSTNNNIRLCKTIKYIFGRNVHLWPKRPSFLAETFIFLGRNVHLSWPNRPYFWPNRSFFFWPKRILAETSCNPTGKCTGTDVVQHLHQRPAHTHRHSQLHLRRRLVHRVARKRLQHHRSVTHVCPEHYDHLLRHKPTACEPFKDTGVCFPPKEPRSQTRTECSVERYQTLKHINTSVSGHPP